MEIRLFYEKRSAEMVYPTGVYLSEDAALDALDDNYDGEVATVTLDDGKILSEVIEGLKNVLPLLQDKVTHPQVQKAVRALEQLEKSIVPASLEGPSR